MCSGYHLCLSCYAHEGCAWCGGECHDVASIYCPIPQSCLERILISIAIAIALVVAAVCCCCCICCVVIYLRRRRNVNIFVDSDSMHTQGWPVQSSPYQYQYSPPPSTYPNQYPTQNANQYQPQITNQYQSTMNYSKQPDQYTHVSQGDPYPSPLSPPRSAAEDQSQDSQEMKPML